MSPNNTFGVRMFSKNFSDKEFERSDTASRLGIDNSLTPSVANNLQYLVDTVLQPLRQSLMRPIRITSGYRSPELNTAVRGSSTSQHMRGEAADIKVAGYSGERLANLIISSGVPFDQLIWYDVERGGHVHIALSKPVPSMQVLHAPKSGGYLNWTTK